jgi:hypothetical protein
MSNGSKNSRMFFIWRVLQDDPKECPPPRTIWAFAFPGLDLFCRSRIVFTLSGGNKYDRALLHSRWSERRPTLRNAYTQTQNEEPDWQQLAQENGSLRAIIAELLIKNQNLRWELQRARMLAGSRS